MLQARGAERGREVIAVDPRHTSQRCSACAQAEVGIAQRQRCRTASQCSAHTAAHRDEAGTEIVNDGFQPEGRDSQEVLSAAEQRVFKIAEQGRRGRADFVSLRDAMKDAFQILQERYENQGNVTGLPTGFSDLDEMTAGGFCFTVMLPPGAADGAGEGMVPFSLMLQVTFTPGTPLNVAVMTSLPVAETLPVLFSFQTPAA